MDSDAEMKARHARLLGRYAEQAASLAEDLHACCLAAETAEQKQALSLAFHRTGRTLRQTLALEARLRRDADHERRLDEDRAAEVAKAKTAARKSRVENAVERLIWTEAEEAEQLDYLQLLTNRLAGEDLDDPDEPLDALIERIAVEIGLQDPPPQGEVAQRAGGGFNSDAGGSNPLRRSATPPPQGGGSEPHPSG